MKKLKTIQDRYTFNTNPKRDEQAKKFNRFLVKQWLRANRKEICFELENDQDVYEMAVDFLLEALD